jgi:threonyl-tRNA synthetase
MVHRSVVGSAERAVAQLIEVHQGAFPPWLAPVQAVVLPVGEAEVAPAAALVRRCVEAGLRAELAGPERGTLGARVRAARLAPYQVVVGPREAAGGAAALRLRDGRRLPPPATPPLAGVPPLPLPAAQAVARMAAAVAARRPELWPEA